MKKVGVITLNDYSNYGNRLQNYALVHYLNEIGVNCYNIWKTSNGQHIKDCIKSIIPIKKYDKFKKYYGFNKRIKTKYTKEYKNITHNYYICGSDQVWNTNFSNIVDMLLNFINDDSKKISYAASFGINKLSDEYKEIFRSKLGKFKSISVREDSGKKIIEELTGRKDVEVLIDPTMLLTTEEWDKVSNKPKNFDKLNGKKYILNYFLGELSDTRKKEIERIAKDNNCEIINLLDKNDPFYISGPSEFLYLEKNAFLICTDSFHSSVFALLYDRPFIIFDREDNEQNMSSRLDTLINKFNLKNRKFNGKITKENLEHDYTEVYKILENERKKSKEFLEKALDIK